MNKHLKSEIWETQVWLMWILALGLYETSHYYLFGLVMLWSLISFIGAVVQKALAIKEDNE